MRLILLWLVLLVAPVAAQIEDLHGTWQSTVVDEQLGEVTTRLTFQTDGSFELDYVIQVKDDFLAPVQAPNLPAMETISAHNAGTYGVLGDWLLFSAAALDLSVDGQDFAEFFGPVARDLSRFAADLHEIPDENYAAFEEAFVAEFFSLLSESFSVLVGEGDGIGTYTVDGDTLFLILAAEDSNETWEFQRVKPSTAVAAASWGRVKAAQASE